MKTRPVGAELFHVDGWMDGWTDRHDATKSFHNFVNAPKKVSSPNNRPWRPTAQEDVSSNLSITSG